MEQDFNFNMRQVAHYCLEILNDLLKSFGLLMSRDLASIQSGILPMLSSPVPATRKRVATCVASLAICAPEQLFVTLVGAIFTNIEAARNADQIRTDIQTIAGISRSVGHRLGRELKRIVPLFMTYCEDKKYQVQISCFFTSTMPLSSLNSMRCFSGGCGNARKLPASLRVIYLEMP